MARMGLCCKRTQCALAQAIEQLLRLSEVWCIKTLGEPFVDRGENVVGFAAAILICKEPSEANSGAQFPQLGVLLLRDCQGSAIELLGSHRIRKSQHHLTFMPI